MISFIGSVLLMLSFCMLPVMYLGDTMHQKRALGVHFVSACSALIVLIYAFITSDMTIDYIAKHSHINMPIYYKITAIWGGHHGSLLLMTVLMSSWVYSAFRQGMKLELRYYAMLASGLYGIIIWLGNPFVLGDHLSGQGLNPLLQDIGMMIHPPILYLGYVASVLPFLLVLSTASLTKRQYDWIKIVSKVALAILTVGIALGSWWAYRILGWGGYWGFDPVENASLLPWIALIGVYHSAMVSNARATRQFALLGFVLSLFSTLMVRSGLLVSVHSFSGHKPALMGFIAYFICVISYCIYYYWRDKSDKKNLPFVIKLQLLCIVFIIALFVLTMIVPMITDFLFGVPTLFSAEFYQKLLLPFILIVLGLMASYLVINRYIYLVVGIATMGYAWYMGSILQGLIIGASIAIILASFLSGKRNYTHLAFVVMVVFMLLNAQMSASTSFTLQLGDTFEYQGQDVTLMDITDTRTPNYVEKTLTLLVGESFLYPKMRYYPLNDLTIAIPDTLLGMINEWHIVCGSMINDKWSITCYNQYWLRYIWGFAVLMALSLVVSKEKRL